MAPRRAKPYKSFTLPLVGSQCGVKYPSWYVVFRSGFLLVARMTRPYKSLSYAPALFWAPLNPKPNVASILACEACRAQVAEKLAKEALTRSRKYGSELKDWNLSLGIRI